MARPTRYYGIGVWLAFLSKIFGEESPQAKSVLLSTLHPISRTGYGGQAQLLVAELKKAHWHVQLLAWNLRHRGEPPAEDLEALLGRNNISQSDALVQAGGDPRALLPGIPLLTARIAPPTGHETGEGWLEILRAVDLLEAAAKNCSTSAACPFRKPDVILHLHDAWWLGPAPIQAKEAIAKQHLPPMVAWLPILFDPLLSDDPTRPDRSGSALELFAGVITMSVWGRGVYESALASWARELSSGAQGSRRLPPLLGQVPHALHPAFSEGPLAFESEARRNLRQQFGLPENAFVVLVVGRNPPPPSSEANRKSHKAGIRAFARLRSRISELCSGTEATEPCARFPSAHLHLHSDLNGAVDLRALLAEVGLSLDPGGGASSSREKLSQEQLRGLYSASDVLLQLSRAEGFGLPVIEAQASGTPVIVNGATAMAENVVLGRVLLPTPRQSPSGGRDDRPGSWTPPDSIAAAEALLGMWVAPLSPTERNVARMILHSNFAQSSIGQQISELLQSVLLGSGANSAGFKAGIASSSGDIKPVGSGPFKLAARQGQSAAFCGKDFAAADACWQEGRSDCTGLEQALRSCFVSEWLEPQLAEDAMPRNRLTKTRRGWPMLYNVYDIMVGRMLEVCGSWLSHEDKLHAILLGSEQGTGRILEAGAHIGAVTTSLAKRIPQGRILALEPSRLNLQLLVANTQLAQLANVDTHLAALGAVSQGTVMVEEHGHNLPFADFRRLGPGTRQRKVSVVSVDQLLGSSVDRLDLLRLGLASTAGHELALAIAGAAKCLERFRPWILIELPLQNQNGKLHLQTEVSGSAETALLSSLHASGYNCIRCDLPLGPSATELTSSSSSSWDSCSSNFRGYLRMNMLFCGHRARTDSPALEVDATTWLQAVQTCGTFLSGAA